MMYEYQNHLTEPPVPVGGYLPKTISDEELKKIINDRADMCMAILNGEEKEYERCDAHCSNQRKVKENDTQD